MMWCDHRALEQAQHIQTDPALADFVRSYGNHISLEWQPPKLMWLHEVPFLTTLLFFSSRVVFLIYSIGVYLVFYNYICSVFTKFVELW